ncbi:HAD family hydrolase [Oceanirhabdus sp. W0125-5]|uniref:HAD family hydrolase n=1 Tax=Oceanirhabdus sp. W0125-5 TaxID=2999116 RepID=UPI0022F33C75|nr:HAD family hydrolase [Oceanirhabdus sp. W0125-5]WBW96933.1 HAD family hydrolase [Oceanirhabdus sp. W0125-5]
MFKVISLDMFQTLVDVNTRREIIWKRILEERYTEELQDKYWRTINGYIFENFHKHCSSNEEFMTIRNIFEIYYEIALKELKSDVVSKTAVSVILEEHGKAELYEDSIEFIDLAAKKAMVCIVSDADKDMIYPILPKLTYDKAFISEEYGIYKNTKGTNIFKHVLEHYNVLPEEILHIGDSTSDILGARKYGIKTCWINRHGYTKRFEGEADYTVTSLKELAEIIF